MFECYQQKEKLIKSTKDGTEWNRHQDALHDPEKDFKVA